MLHLHLRIYFKNPAEFLFSYTISILRLLHVTDILLNLVLIATIKFMEPSGESSVDGKTIYGSI